MSEDQIPTVFLGGRKAVLERMGINGDWKSAVKVVLAITLVLASVALFMFRDAVFTIRESGVSSERIAKVEVMQQEFKTEYVRKDVLEPRLDALEQNVKEMREGQKETNRLLTQLLLEKRGK